MLQDLTSSEVTELLAYAYIDAGGLKRDAEEEKREEDRTNRVMVKDLRNHLKSRVVKHG